MFESNSKYGTNIVGCKGLQYFKPLNLYTHIWVSDTRHTGVSEQYSHRWRGKYN